MKKDLQPFSNIKDDLLFWIKEYYIVKTLELFENSKSNKIDDIIASIELIKESRDIDEAKSNSYKLVTDGLKSMSRIISGTYKLYIFIVNRTESIKMIDTNTLQDFSKWLTLSDTTRRGYIDACLELLMFIQRNNKESFIFNIEKDIVRIKRKSIPRKMIDVMDNEEYEKFNRKIPQYSYKNEYEKSRNVLICRLLLFSGITVPELLSLELDKSFIVDNNLMLVRLENRKRDIDLPRRLLITYFNKYKEQALKNKNYDVSVMPLINISKDSVSNIVKELLIYSNIKRSPLSPQLLRYSFFVYIYNKRCASNEITFKTIHDISGIVNKKELENILYTFDKEHISIAKIFSEENFK